MRVLLVGTGVLPIPPTGYGGVERTIAEYAQALTRAGETAVVVNRVRNGRSSDEYRFALELPRLLRGSEADIVHASTPVVANRLRLSGLPYVYTTHSRHWFYRKGWRERWGYFLERRAVHGSAATVALTSPLEQTIRSSLGKRVPARMPVIPIGVDTDRFVPAWDRRQGNVALGVGVVARFKRWELAAAGLKGTGWRLVIAGPSTDREYGDRVRAAGDRVELLGELSQADLERRYAESDILVHPSEVEILAGAVIQGLSSGLPVLGGPAIRGLVEEGTTGWSASSDDPQAIVESIRRHATELTGDVATLRRLGERARAEAARRYAWPAVVAAHLDLYRAIAPRVSR